MDFLIDFNIIIYFFISISYMLYLYAKYDVCPEFLWSGMQLLMFFGITLLFDRSVQSDRELLFYYLLGLLCFMVFSAVGRAGIREVKKLNTYSNPDGFLRRKYMVWIIMLVSIAACAYFYMKGGGNVFINGLRAMISNDSDYSTKYSRMALLSIKGVGYIYQLRVMILPLVTLYYTMMNPKKLLSYVLLCIMLLYLIGTGQRGGFFSVIAIILLTIYYWTSSKHATAPKIKKTKKIAIYIAILGVSGVLFALATIMNGRVAEGSTVFAAILKRFVKDNQSCAVHGFRYIKTLDIQYGKDWFMQLRDILPGKNSYRSLATRIFAYRNGGSTAGTAPACVWGVAYYNFGIFGVLLHGIFSGLLMGNLHKIFKKKQLDEFAVICYSAIQFLIAYWVADGPIVLFNNGCVAAFLLYILINISGKFVFKFHPYGDYRLNKNSKR